MSFFSLEADVSNELGITLLEKSNQLTNKKISPFHLIPRLQLKILPSKMCF